MTESAASLRVVEETPEYWRVVFDYPPFNMVDATIFEGLQDHLARMDGSQSLRVVSSAVIGARMNGQCQQRRDKHAPSR